MLNEILTSPIGRWLLPFLPSTLVVVTLAPLAAAYAAVAGGCAGMLRIRRGMRAPYTRKVFHFAIFTMAGLIHLRWGLPGVVVFGSVVALAVIYAVWRGEGFPFYEALARPSDAPKQKLFILVPLLTTALGGVASNLLFPPAAYVGYMVAGWGDAIGEPVGTRWGRHRYTVPSLAGVPATRSLEGSAAVFLMGSAAAILALWVGGADAGSAVLAGLACGVVGALVEAASTHGLDNFTVQVAAAATAYLLLH